jgi:hypothetical protein
MRPAATAIVVLFAVAALRADEPPAPAQGADSIAAAKKDFAAIKSSSLAPDTTSALPTLDMKDMGPTPGAQGISAPTPLPSDRETPLDPTKKAAGTGNWLVDAMDKEKNSENPRPSRPGDERLRAEPPLETDPEKADSGSARDAASGAEQRETTPAKEPAEHVYNPLDSFMASWVSARDHDLLVPASKGESPGGADAAPRGDAPAGPDPMPSGSLVDMLLPAPDTASWDETKPEANPFVAPPDTEAAPAVRLFSGGDAGGFAPFGPADLVPGGGTSGPSAQPAEAARSYLPDFAQPLDDDKYFRQMKRF